MSEPLIEYTPKGFDECWILKCIDVKKTVDFSVYNLFLQVSSIYKDPSIGNLINIVIVKLVIINNELVRLQH